MQGDWCRVSSVVWQSRHDILFVEGFCEQPDDDGEVFAFVVGWEDDGILVCID